MQPEITCIPQAQRLTTTDCDRLHFCRGVVTRRVQRGDRETHTSGKRPWRTRALQTTGSLLRFIWFSQMQYTVSFPSAHAVLILPFRCGQRRFPSFPARAFRRFGRPTSLGMFSHNGMAPLSSQNTISTNIYRWRNTLGLNNRFTF